MIVRPEAFDGTDWLPTTQGGTTQIEFDGSGNPIYIGIAATGSATSSAKWQIRKLTWTASNPTSIQWAGGTRLFNNIWDNRAALAYS